MNWIKSGRCDTSSCAEATWVKSHHCDTNSCAEATIIEEGTVFLRNSTDPDGPMLGFTSAEWAGFVLDMRSGDFPDLLEREKA